MNRSQLQTVQRLLAEKISGLELQRLDLRAACRSWWKEASPVTVAGQEAYRELNYCRNRLRETNKRLRELRSLAVSIKTELSLQSADPFKINVIFVDEDMRRDVRSDSILVD